MNTKNKLLTGILLGLIVAVGALMFSTPAIADTPVSGYFLSATQYASHTPITGPGTYSLLVDAMNNLRVAEDMTYNQNVINLNNSTTSLKTTAGLLHTITGDTVASGTVLTVYDDAGGTVVPTAYATSTITIGASSSATSTTTGTISAVISGFTITSAQISNASTSVQAAVALTTAINASSSVINFITATSSSNIVTLTAAHPNGQGNFSTVVTSPQIGFPITVSSTPSLGTPVIAQITTNGNVPFTLTFDTAFNNGLLVTETGATSTFTISSE